MGKMMKVSLTDEAKALLKDVVAMNEANDCTVRAVTILTETKYESVRQRFETAGRKARHGAYNSVTIQVIEQIGWSVSSIDPKTFIDRYPKPHCWALKHVTTHHPRRFREVWNDGKRYLLACRGHVLAVKSGMVHDWSINRSLRVIQIYNVEKK